MIPRVYVDGDDISDVVLFESLAIHQDSTSRVATAEFTVKWRGDPSRWDTAQWDVDRWAVGLEELADVAIWDTGTTPYVQVFGGAISYISYERQSPSLMFIRCQCQDFAVWLENTVIPYEDMGLGGSDQYILKFLIDKYAAGKLSSAGVEQILPVVPIGVVENQTLRQVIEWISDLSNAHWHVAPNGTVVYHRQDSAVSSYGLSDQPDRVTTFPFSISSYSRDFARPINHSIVSGAYLPDGSYLRVEYQDPVSVGRYGLYTTTLMDRSLADGNEARLRAEAVVEASAYPKQTGTLITYTDVFHVGDYVAIQALDYGIGGSYLLSSADIKQLNRTETQYTFGFGPQPPDTERLLRVLERWMRTETGAGTMSGVPLPGSVTDDSLAGDFTVNGSAIVGIISGNVRINASTLYGILQGTDVSVAAGTIIGTISGSNVIVDAGTIEGVIEGADVHVSATTIQGVIVSEQLANGIVDDLAKYAAALRPIPMLDAGPALPSDNYPPGSYFYYIPDGNFYRITANGDNWDGPYTSVSGHLNFYHIGSINATSIIGLIVAAQIESITAGKITGQITADQIYQVNASAIIGTITAGQNVVINAAVIQGVITGPSISVSTSVLTGVIQGSTIQNINATTITIGLLDTDNRISRISGAKLDVGTVNTDKLNAFAIAVGGGGNKPGRLEVYNGAGVLIGFIGTSGVNDGGYFKTLGVGGSQASPSLFADANGKLTINNADFILTTASKGVIEMTSTKFDDTYSSVGVNVHDTSNAYMTWTVSKGFVGKYLTTPMYSLNVSPTQYNAGECVVYNNGAISIWLDGATGTVRASKFQITGAAVGFNGAIPPNKTINVQYGIVMSYTPFP